MTEEKDDKQQEPKPEETKETEAPPKSVSVVVTPEPIGAGVSNS